jgi:hypothetical protein
MDSAKVEGDIDGASDVISLLKLEDLYNRCLTSVLNGRRSAVIHQEALSDGVGVTAYANG